MAKIKITLQKSLIGRPPKQHATVKALGLSKVHRSVIRESNPATLGLVRKVAHLVSVEKIDA